MKIDYSILSSHSFEPPDSIQLRRYIDLLPDEQREVIILRYYADLSFKEIADLVSTSVNTVLGRSRYALINIKNLHSESISTANKIIKQKEIISEIKVFDSINHDLLKAIKKNNKLLWEINSRQFEEVIAELFKKGGFDIELTGQTHDGGTDIIATQNGIISDNIWFIECKHYNLNRPVGINIFREVYGTHELRKPNKSIIVTSSYFTKPVIQEAEKIRPLFDLKDHKEVLRLINYFS